MIINRNLSEYLVANTSSLADALAKISLNRNRICYIVDASNRLQGCLSDGDVRRWLLDSEELDLSVDVGTVANLSCFSLSIEEDSDVIQRCFDGRIFSVPLVDSVGHLIAIAEQRSQYFQVGDKKISEIDPVFIIAEIGNNHQGDVLLAKKLVDYAVSSKVDCVKFQLRNMERLYRNSGDSSDASADLGAQYTLDLLAKFQLPDEALFELFDYCKEKGVLPLCTPWDLASLRKLEDYGMPAYKIASADFTNYELLEAVSKTKKPFFCSTGMSTESEIQSTVKFLKKHNADFILLHCNSTYPTPYKDVNLNYIRRLNQTTNSLIGYSGHERGWSVPVAAVALGAKVIEKHLTTDKELEGNDHKVSLLPDEFKHMVNQIRQVEEALGHDKPREISQGELMNREVLAKSLIINCDLELGQVIQENMLDVLSPGQGLQPNRKQEVIGKRALRPLKKGDFLYEGDLDGSFIKKSSYEFDRPYGIPVRYHDYEKLTCDVSLDFVEFHLSYKDLEMKPSDFLKAEQDIGFAVHAPELFSGDHLLDLSADDHTYRERSVYELTRVVELARDLKAFFPKTQKPIIVVNVGGWSYDGFLSSEEKEIKYEAVKNSFSQLDLTDVQIAIQTMPPFPWHFGGQSHHNLFVHPSEISDFCEETGLKICLDVSHSMMACNYYGWNLEDFVRTVAPYNVHLHIVDAKGADGEGVQMGQGDVNFEKLGILLKEVSPRVQFIPEVWQGHKNHGQGFWSGLAYLERFFAPPSNDWHGQ